jgi:hypothetical protein
MDARQFLRGVNNPMEPYTLPHLGLVPSYQRRLDAIYPGEDSRQRAYDVTRADFERLLGLGRVDMLKGFIASRLSGTMYEDINELAFALGRSVDELQYYLNADPLELLRQAEAQQEAVRLAQIAADNERIRLQQEAERLAAEEAQRQSIAEAQRIVAETAAIDAARTAQLIAQSEARLRAEVREQWPAGDIDRQITLYEQLRTQPPRSDAEVQSIIRDAIGDGAEFQLLMRYINNWRAGIEPAETFRQIQIEQAEAEQYERLAPIREARAQAQAQLQYLAETGLVPVEIMIETGAWSQEQIEIARQVQADRLAKEQAAFQAEIDRQDAERSARVQAEIAQAAADEAERVRLYIADQQAKAQAEYDAQQAALEAERARVAAAQAAAQAAQAAQAQAQAAAAQVAEAAAIKRSVDEAAARAAAQGDLDALAETQAIQQIVNQAAQAAQAQAAAALTTRETVMFDLEAAIAQGQADFNAAVRAIRSQMAEIAGARVYGVPYVLPVWSVEYPTIPADLVDSLLAQFQLPSAAELEAELAASQAAAPVVDELPFVVVEETSRQIVAPEVITAPAAPSDVIAPAVQQPVAPVVPAAPAAPAAGGGAALLLALASAYFLGV